MIRRKAVARQTTAAADPTAAIARPVAPSATSAHTPPTPDLNDQRLRAQLRCPQPSAHTPSWSPPPLPAHTSMTPAPQTPQRFPCLRCGAVVDERPSGTTAFRLPCQRAAAVYSPHRRRERCRGRGGRGGAGREIGRPARSQEARRRGEVRRRSGRGARPSRPGRGRGSGCSTGRRRGGAASGR